MHEKTTVCIHCGAQENLFPVGIVRSDFLVGFIYFCQDCQGVLEKSTLEVFLNPEEEQESVQALH